MSKILLSAVNKTFSKSELSIKDALMLGEKVKGSLHRRFKQENSEKYPPD